MKVVSKSIISILPAFLAFAACGKIATRVVQQQQKSDDAKQQPPAAPPAEQTASEQQSGETATPATDTKPSEPVNDTNIALNIECKPIKMLASISDTLKIGCRLMDKVSGTKPAGDAIKNLKWSVQQSETSNYKVVVTPQETAAEWHAIYEVTAIKTDAASLKTLEEIWAVCEYTDIKSATNVTLKASVFGYIQVYKDLIYNILGGLKEGNKWPPLPSPLPLPTQPPGGANPDTPPSDGDNHDGDAPRPGDGFPKPTNGNSRAP
jgi:hypothetical protein